MLRTLKMSAVTAGLLLGLGLSPARAAEGVAPAGKATITVTVVDTDSKPVAGVTVSLMAGGKAARNADATTKPAKPEALETATTDDQGKATLTAVADGSYRVAVKLKKVGNGRAQVVVADGKNADVTVTIKPKAPKA